MTRKDYVAIARAVHMVARDFSGAGALPIPQSVYEIADRLADVCAADNPRFDRERFLQACGVKS